MSYRNAYYDHKERGIVLSTWDTDGKRIEVKASYEPYIYVEGSGGIAESIFGTKLVKRSFRTQFDRYKFIKDTEVVRIFENLPPVQQYLVDTFWKENEDLKFSQHPIKIVFLDIEVYAPDKFPRPEEAKEPINVITIYDSLANKYFTWAAGDFVNNDPDVIYKKCHNERDILIKFIEYIEKDYPDILTGWNSETFDIPYVINRVANLLGEEFVQRLSPAKRVTSRSIRGQFGRDQIRWYIEGVSVVDYLDIYKRFCLGQRESFKLNSIAETELGEKKVDIGGMSLATLADTNWQKFIEYNIVDVKLLRKLDDKLKYIELVRLLAYVGLTTFENAMSTLAVINGAAAVRARFRNQRIPTFIRDSDDSVNPGAYVAEPRTNFQEKIVSFDANSLYPNVMISLNMSPETKIGVISNTDTNSISIKHVSGKVFTLTPEKYAIFLEKEQIAVSKANVLFSQKNKGLMPEILDYYAAQRQEIKKQLKKYKKDVSTLSENTVEAKNINTKITQLNGKQLCIKVLVNGLYGYFGNKHAPMGDDNIASSVTLTGQSVIKQSNILLKEFIKERIKDVDDNTLDKCIIYNDTDSSYISISPFFVSNDIKFKNEEKLSQETLKLVQEIEDYLNKNIKIWGVKEFRSKDCRFVFKREVIADTGLFVGKKRYVLHVLDDEGIPCNKFKYTGVEVVRSTMPVAVRPYVKKIIETMLTTQNIVETSKVLNETYEIFKSLPIETISLVSGLNGFEEKEDQCDEFDTAKGMTVHAKAAYYYNTLLERFKLDNKYEKIASGDKVRYFYVMRPNPFNINAIGYKYTFPEEFKSKLSIDFDRMFNSHVFSIVERFYENVNWQAQQPGTLTQTNLFNLLS
jgi:DNA polymerase elongation subunit (family B)